MISCRSSFRIGCQQQFRSQCVIIPRRWKKKAKKKYTKPGTFNITDPAAMCLKYFDETYKVHFGNLWPMIRLGLLSPHKYGALINNYTAAVDTNTIHIDRLKRFGAVDVVEDAYKRMRNRTSTTHDNKDEETDQQIINSNLTEPEGLSQEFSQEQILHPTEIAASSDLQTSEQHDESESKSEDDKNWWEDKFIVAPGYEGKMDDFIKSGEVAGTKSAGLTTQRYPSLVGPSSDIKIIQKPFNINHNLKCYIHQDDGNVKHLPRVKSDPGTRLLMHYNMDAASILPVLALDLQPDDDVLDLCAAPGGKTVAMVQTMCADLCAAAGGKTVAMVQTMCPGGIRANEIDKSRRQRLNRVLTSYVPETLLESGSIAVARENGCDMGDYEPNAYDKVLVDVPCTNDRKSAADSTNNIFTERRSKERHDLPKLQKRLLCSALQAVKPGGDVVYSTCTLSQLQNDDVIESALSTCRSQLKIKVAVVDLSPLTSAFDDVFHFWKNSLYGQLVLPGLRRNFGPMYFCRLHKLK